MINYSNIKEILDIIQKYDNFIITTHPNPDGDAIGSVISLYEFIQIFGKNVRIINLDKTPKNFQFLDNNKIEVFDSEKHTNDFLNSIVFVLDLNDPYRLKNIGEILLKSTQTIIVIDHHIDPKPFATNYFCFTEKGSTCEIVWELAEFFKEKLTKEFADACYTGIMTDHGGFRFDRTNARTFEIVAELCKLGALPERIFDSVNNQLTHNGLKLTARALNSIELYFDGFLGIMSIRKIDFEQTGGTEEDIEGLASKVLAIEGVNAGVFIIESQTRKELRVSFRSKNGFIIREVAEIFGGGGHNYASGARIDLDYENAKNKIIEEVGKKINEIK